MTSRSSSPITVVFESSGLRNGRGELARRTRDVLEVACGEMGWPGAGIAVLYCSDERIENLNRQFREVKEPTDTLSFPAAEDVGRLNPADKPYLGDLAIAIPYTNRHAKEQGRTLNEEIDLLLVHGLLHLLGWDHATAGDKKRMWAEQERVLGIVNSEL